MINIEREKAKRKIIALLNKTVDRGATEEEAMAAAEKAGELMAFYDIESGELEFQEKNIVKEVVTFRSYLQRPYISTSGIAKLCQCRNWRNTGTDTYTFFGFKSDVEIAVAMFSYLEDAAYRASRDFRHSAEFTKFVADGYDGKSVVSAFNKGFDSRLYTRLVELAKDRNSRVVLSTGTSLVPMKEAEIDRELNAQGVVLRNRSINNRVRAYGAYERGANAANAVGINRQVRSGGSVARIAS
jgi:hypothetical protein